MNQENTNPKSQAEEKKTETATAAKPVENKATVASRETSARDSRNQRGNDRKRPSFRKREESSDFMEKVLSIKRVTKVTKGGKKLSFSALVVVGDMKGNVGYNLGKAGEVAIAIRKAIEAAKKNMVKISLTGTTISHEIIGVCGGADGREKRFLDTTARRRQTP